MSLTEYRMTPSEKERTNDLVRQFPASGSIALDIGARDGHFSLLLAERFERVVALDLTKPHINHPRVDCVQGNAESLAFESGAFDFVFCAEVLEHIQTPGLVSACKEVERVGNGLILIGVPYRQDIRVGRTTCNSCGRMNPPWGHVNSFDEHSIATLFASSEIKEVTFVGSTSEATNTVSSKLMDLAGNPYGTYSQEEPCGHCGATLMPPPQRTLPQRLLTRAALWTRHATQVFEKPHGNWIHVLLAKRQA